MKRRTDPRHKARRLALMDVYSMLMNGNIRDSERDGGGFDSRLYEQLINGYKNHAPELESIIKSNVQHWDDGTIINLDNGILLLATWELLQGEVPEKVVIDEAIELAKEFSDAASPKFVNGILSNIVEYVRKTGK